MQATICATTQRGGLVAMYLLVMLCASACGNNEENNTPEADMGVDMAADMRADGPDDCGDGTWFDPATSTCAACPAPAFSCDLIDLERSSVDIETNILTLALKDGHPHVVSMTLEGKEEVYLCNEMERTCNTIFSSEFSKPIEQPLKLNTINLTSNSKEAPTIENDTYRIQSLKVVNQCQDEVVVPFKVAWGFDRETSINKEMLEPMSCAQ